VIGSAAQQTQKQVIDVVIPCHPKDAPTLNAVIHGIRAHGRNIRRVIVISAEPLTNKAEWFDEAAFPFTPYDVALVLFKQDPVQAQRFCNQTASHLGWIYQQLLKFYAVFVIPDIAPNILVLDADTIFLRGVTFIDSHDYTLFNVSTEHHDAYFQHMHNLLPGLQKVFPAYSGITHHMLFQKHILEDLFQEIRGTHQEEPWRAICKTINHDYLYNSCMSEYELYFNFAFSKHYHVKIRPLRWCNVSSNNAVMKNKKYKNMHYIACHHYMAAHNPTEGS
jgi:hypothetical protein